VNFEDIFLIILSPSLSAHIGVLSSNTGMNTFYRVYNLKKFSREAAEAQRKEKDFKKGERIPGDF